ncbi:MAG TPA: FkbM family methyltransferase, partial [Candidatus Deferrimicrobium sp.]|nr:FkbM family methyltransferase [Candidatus Deferrimicrobium sp.]
HAHVEFKIEYEEVQTRAFDLAKAPLLRVGLNKNILMIDMHHIIADGMSSAVLINDFAAIYKQKVLPELTIHYKDYVAWHNREKSEKQHAYWRQEFAGEIPVLELPVDYVRPAVQSFAGKSIEFETQTPALENGVTLYQFLLAIYNIFLAKVSNREDIIIGTPVAGRRHADLEKIIGMFVNTLALRNYPSGEKKFSNFLAEVKEKTLNAFENQDYPYEDILDEIDITRDTSRNPLYDAAFTLQNFDAAEVNIPGLALTLYKYENTTSKFDLTLSALEEEDKILFTFEYSTKLFKTSTIERFILYFKNILDQVIANKDLPISSIEIITAVEKERILYDFNRTSAGYAAPKTIPQLFTEQVEKKPDHIALVGADPRVCPNHSHCLTYRHLDDQSGRLAGFLIAHGTNPGDIIAIQLERSNEMIINILGILKSGAAYMPLNPKQPDARTRFMIKDSKAKWLPPAAKNPFEKGFLDFPKLLFNFAYLIYTSGSSGVPKGVPVTHANLSPLLHWGYRNLDINQKDRVIQNLSYYFDWSVWEIFITLTSGASLHMISESILLNPETEVDFILKNAITVLHITPTQYGYLLNAGKKLTSLKYLFIGAEKLTFDLLERSIASVNEDCRIFNMYGPTETTIISATLEIPKPHYIKYKELTSIPIGTPTAGLLPLILNKYNQLCPVKIVGELYIGGPGVANGYLNNPELTAEKFITKSFSGGPGGRLFKKAPLVYKTGDLARWLPDGNIEYLGRIDHQVKIRGYRIELAELENQVLKFEPVKNATAKVYKDETGENHLALYIVPDPEKAFTVDRLSDLEKQKILEKYLYYELPNGMPVFYLNRGETDFMYREIFENLTYSKQGIVLPGGACIIDVGANIGLFSLFALQQCQDAAIYAFEPIPTIFEILALNASIYKGHIECFQYGLADKDGEADFTYYPHATVLSGRFADPAQERKNVRSFMLNESTRLEEGKISGDQLNDLLESRLESVRFNCRFKTLSNVIREKNIPVVDLLKIDVEKSEIDVLKGIAETDWHKIRQVVMEVHNVDGRLATIIEILKQHGYEVMFDQDQELRDTDLYNIYARQTRWEPAKEGGSKKEPAWLNTGQLIDDTREFLKTRLPAYMIPSFFTVLKELPLTVNGKIDRSALPQPGIKTRGKYVAPGNPIEEKIAGTWKDILKLDRVDVHTSFFNLGGTSIQIIQVNTQLKNLFNIDVPVAAMFEHPTVRTLSGYIMKRLPDQEIPTDETDEEKNIFKAIHTGRNKLKDRKKMIIGD